LLIPAGAPCFRKDGSTFVRRGFGWFDARAPIGSGHAVVDGGAWGTRSPPIAVDGPGRLALVPVEREFGAALVSRW